MQRAADGATGTARAEERPLVGTVTQAMVSDGKPVVRPNVQRTADTEAAMAPLVGTGGQSMVPDAKPVVQRAGDTAVQHRVERLRPAPPVVQRREAAIPSTPNTPNMPVVQRATEPEHPEHAPETAVQVVEVQRTAEPITESPAPAQNGAAPAQNGAAPAQNAAAPPQNAEELLRKLYDPLLRRLKADLWLDRERRGALTDL
ncbi:hypothetical protein [Lentzea sp. E54]|uniref:hypothetical protein n=1 Tax=Lentzea xerophila TaxID=3435883 RepID=UPI003DA554A0